MNNEELADRGAIVRGLKLMGLSSAQIRRAGLIAELPHELFEALLLAADGPPSETFLVAIALALRRGEARGNVLRIRGSEAHLTIVYRWLSERDRLK